MIEGEARELAEGDGEQGEVDAGQREAEAEIAHDRAGKRRRRDSGEDAGPRADAVMEEQSGGDVAAEAGIERVAQ